MLVEIKMGKFFYALAPFFFLPRNSPRYQLLLPTKLTMTEGMMSAIETVINKAISDAEFCEKLISSPVEVLQSEGVEASDELVSAVKELDVTQLQETASAFDKKHVAS